MRESQLIKYDPNGKLLMRYSNKVLGAMEAVDASNPMKILLFYPELNRIVFLDNQLSENGPPVNLVEPGLDQTVLACTSHDNGFWVYDQREFEIVRLDQELKVSHRSGNIPLQTGIAIKPIAIYQYQNSIYLYDSNIGFLIFDIFGTYTKTLPLKGIYSISFSDNCVYFLQESKLYKFNLLSLQQSEMSIPLAGANQVVVLKDGLAVRTDEKIWVYRKD
jgi:hypothetical protein